MSHNKGIKSIHNNQLRQEREKRGWSRAYVAEQIEVDVASVGRWERGERLPHPHHRQKLCELLEKSALDLGLLSELAAVYDDVPPAPDLQGQGVLLDEKDTTHPLTKEQPVSISQSGEVPSVSLEALSVEDGVSASKALTLMSQQNREKMLRKMHAFWIDGVLEQSLRATGPIPLELKEQYDAVTDPWVVTLQRTEVPSCSLPSYTHIGQTYDEANGELLILGEPGSGKTTLLLELARILLERATRKGTHPIPLVFNLASWAIKRQPLSDWLIEELRSKYQVPRKLAQTWVQMEQILPLLDGLDEVIVSARSACIEAINAYRQEHGLQPMVVCSRLSDYFMQSSRLLLRRAVTVQHLSIARVEEYLVHAGNELAALHRTLQEDPMLLELATSPLLLNILALTYQNRTVDMLSEPLSLESRRNEVFANYVGRMLTRRKSYYTAERTLHWLSWLARQQVQKQQTEFYIERMQPSWIAGPVALRWYCGILVGLLVGLLGSLTGMLADVSLYEVVHKRLFEIFAHTPVSNLQCADTLPLFDTMPETIASLFSLPVVGLLFGIGFGISGGLLGGLLSGRSAHLQPVEKRTWVSRFSRYICALLLGMVCGSIFLWINLLWVPCPFDSTFYNQVAEELVYGVCGVFVGGFVGLLAGDLFGRRKYHIQLTEALVWTRVPGRRQFISSLLGGSLGLLIAGGTELISEIYLRFSSWESYLLISALIGGLLGALIGKGLGGFSRHKLEKYALVKPNEGIRRSLRNGVIIGFPVGMALSCFTLGLILWLDPTHISDGLLWSFPLGQIVTIILVLLNGGYACLQHAVLRLVLRVQGNIPWNYARFLDEAASRMLLRKVGGGYIFIHRLLLEYFASSDTDSHEKYHPSKARYRKKEASNRIF
ncbi:MAG: helix-turn-helix domain-containing protein [Ktedonobacteraceae bacterium]|nr:helix-turn-helix domain-containing protein [Ktedonobacteraceae bacterium]